MNLFSWLTNSFSVRGKSLAIYHRAMGKMAAGDTAGAIAGYTAIVELARVPADVKAMALFNRGLAHHAARNQQLALADFEAVLEMPDAPGDVKAATREKLTRWSVRNEKKSGKVQ